RHLVSSARFVFDYAMYARVFGGAEYFDAARHCVSFIRDAHRNPATGGYAWTLRDGKPQDTTNHCYGAAFVLVAYAHARMAGVDEAAAWMDEHWKLLEQRFWDAVAGLYRDEADANWTFSNYRGQPRTTLARPRLHAGRPHDPSPGGQGWRPSVGTLRPELGHRLGVPQGQSKGPVPALGFPARPPDRMGQA